MHCAEGSPQYSVCLGKNQILCMRPERKQKKERHTERQKERIYVKVSSISGGRLLAAVCVHSEHAHEQSILETCGRNRYPQYVLCKLEQLDVCMCLAFRFLNGFSLKVHYLCF